MKLTQISIFLENKKGRLFDVCTLLGKKDVNIRALTVAESPDYGILRIIVDKPDIAIEVLKKNGFTANQTDIIAVEIEDKPGGLVNILKVINENNLNIEYLYGFIEKLSNKALIVFRFDDIDRAISVLLKNNIKIVKRDEIIKL